jgi:hypothetical protein
MKNLKNILRTFSIILLFSLSFLLIWCWSSWGDSFSINEYGFELNYDWKVKLEKIQLKADDMEEIIDLFQEVGEDLVYRDSLLIAEKYSQWLWTNAFTQDNLDALEDQWLTLSNIEKTQIWFEKNWEKINAVLVEYEITKWLINDIPLLYVSQLFVPNEENIVLMSFITEDKSSRLSASRMFKNIK